MRLPTKLAVFALALAMLAALALGAAAPATAGFEPASSCAELESICSIFVTDFYYAGCLLNWGLLSGLECGTCSLLDNYCAACIVDQQNCTYSALGYDGCVAAKAAQIESFTGEALVCEGNCGDDGRVNTNCSAPEIVYCKGGYAEFWKYDYSELDAFFHFKISLDDLNKSVAVKTLIKQVGTVQVWLMPDGRVLLVAQQTDLKDYYMYWDPSVCASLQEGAEWNVQ